LSRGKPRGIKPELPNKVKQFFISGIFNVHSVILILAIIIVDEVFSPDKNQKVTPGFMQDAR
jgi:hypothetical protein